MAPFDRGRDGVGACHPVQSAFRRDHRFGPAVRRIGVAFDVAEGLQAVSFADPRSEVAYGYTRRRFSFATGGGAAENRRLAAVVLRAAEATR
ncbi:hypothetical protein QFZ82_001699 [Streptomyces sp. V4I23]|nr:hypothetical protein [Streptomyces sp. V4I23]